MAVILVGLLICGCIAAAATAPTCGINGPPPEISQDDILFTVNVECLPSGLSITWTALEGEYFAELNYICTDTHGSTKTEHHNGTIVTRELSGSVVTSATLIQSVLRNGGECTVYGCHRQVFGSAYDIIFYNNNESCEYTQPATEVSPISSSTDGISPTSTSMHNSAIIISTITSTELLTSTSRYLSHTDNPSHTYIKFPAISTSSVAATRSPRIYTSVGETMILSTPEAEIPTSSPSHAYIKFPATSTSYPSFVTATPSSTPEATLTSIPPSKRGHSITVIIVTAVVVTFAFFILVILVIGIFHFNKKKLRMNPRFKNLGIALHVDSEKIDPYYTPIQVDSYISKSESMGSILEYLTPDKKQATKFTLPMKNPSETAQQEADELQMIPMHYVLQPPPLKQLDSFILSRKESSESSSGYQSSNTSIATSTLPHLGETPLPITPGEAEFESASLLHSTSFVNEHHTTACSNLLFEQMLRRTSSSFSADSQSTTVAEDNHQGLHSKIISYYDIDKLILSQTDEDSDVEDSLGLFQDNRVILTFSSSQSDDNETVILMEPESADSDSTREEFEDHGLSEKLKGSLAETNLTINPHHFDPL